MELAYALSIILFWLCAFVIFWAMLGYPISIRILGTLIKRNNVRDYSRVPTVTVMVVAHNEEKVIKEKLENLLRLEYPADMIEVIVTSDSSTDDTNGIVEQFAQSHPEMKLRLHQTREHKGKTNAQNEAQKLVSTEFLVMTDANAMLEPNSIKELMACFTSPDIAYVCGCLRYQNTEESSTAGSEGLYWSMDVAMREIEGRIASLTAGNGALYACRNSDYFDADSIQCHDSIMPYHFALEGKRSINCLQAVAHERAGATDADEYKRKVRMFRSILDAPVNMLRVANPFRFGWLTYFYFGHRFCRYSLWWAHPLLIITNILLAKNSLYLVVLIAHITFYIAAAFQSVITTSNQLLIAVRYYVMTVIAQINAVIISLKGEASATWSSSETTR